METWKDIPDYEGLYQASNLGEIRTVEGKVTSNARHAVRRWKSRILKGRGNNPKTGRRVSLWKDGKRRDYLVARLVAVTFLGKPPEGFTVNHKDGNRFNNKIENLEWLSIGDNIRHGFVTGLYSNQKEIRVFCNGYIFVFRAFADLDRHIGRRVGYTSDTLARGGQLKDLFGNVYDVICRKE